MNYTAPLRDMQFVLNELAGLEQIAALPAYAELDVGPELAEAVLEEAGKLAGNVIAPLNRIGDTQGARLLEHGVVASPGFKDAYQQFVEGGWNGLVSPAEYEGQGLPELLGTAAHEIWQAANMAFALCPMLTAGAVEALKVHGSEAQKATYLAKLVSGEWTGTMNLTEPQAGSDLSAVRSRAVPESDYYRVYGQKIFITWGDHDMTDNVVHLVLARTPDAPEGVKGISLFIVPKFLVNADGSLGARNDVHCVSLEHKLGIHGSPTAVLAFGDKTGAVGYLVGQENKGLAYMFTMMNEARLKVGIQGLGIAERAYQQAVAFAKDRVQGRPAGAKSGERVAIIQHPDVRRMLLSMKSRIEAMRALCYSVAASMDLAHHDPDAAVRAAQQARVDLLIPVVKGWCTELGIEIASTGVQVHGGMGYVEETGAAQHFRDARITTIYEGTTGIQAADLVGRKVVGDDGAAMAALLAEMRATEAQLVDSDNADLAFIGAHLAAGIQALATATDCCLASWREQPNNALAASVDYLLLVGYVCGGWLMGRAALVAQARLTTDRAFYGAKRVTASFYAEHYLPLADALLAAVQSGGATIMALDPDQF